MRRLKTCFSGLLLVYCLWLGPSASQAEPVDVTAVDIALEPDAVMIEHARAANARLRKDFPHGFALDATHHPHITLLQRYVRTAELEQLESAVGKILAETSPTSWKLTAFKYYYLPWQGNGLAGIVVQPTPALIALQQRIVDAVAPFTVPRGTAAAFVTTPEQPDVDRATIDYIAGFVPERTGRNFNPHVTIGIASTAFLDQMLAQPFDAFQFSPTGASLYHLGNFGTARVRLKAFQLQPADATH